MKSRIVGWPSALGGLFALLLCFWLVGCQRMASLEEFAGSPDGIFASTALEQFRAGRFSALKDKLHPALRTADAEQRLISAVDKLPQGAPLEVKVVGYSLNTVDSVLNANVTYQYRFASGWWLGNVAFTRDAGQTSITNLSLNRIVRPLEELNSFGFSRAGSGHYLFLFASVGLVLFAIITFVVCLRTPMLKHKWLWALFIVSMGVGQLNFNWSTGEVTTKLLHVNVPSASYYRAGPYAPWIFSVSFPLGAILFWRRRRWFIEQHTRWSSTPTLDSTG